jgi:hypothetical protein
MPQLAARHRVRLALVSSDPEAPRWRCSLTRSTVESEKGSGADRLLVEEVRPVNGNYCEACGVTPGQVHAEDCDIIYRARLREPETIGGASIIGGELIPTIVRYRQEQALRDIWIVAGAIANTAEGLNAVRLIAAAALDDERYGGTP